MSARLPLVFCLVVTLLGCHKHKSSKGASDKACGPGRETLNGYMDQDGCPDSLARIKIIVIGRSGEPLKDAVVYFPGLGTPLKTDVDGIAVMFELLPVPSMTLDIASADEKHIQSVSLQLQEGANEITVRTNW